jgi:hypothetical protein
LPGLPPGQTTPRKKIEIWILALFFFADELLLTVMIGMNDEKNVLNFDLSSLRPNNSMQHEKSKVGASGFHSKRII